VVVGTPVALLATVAARVAIGNEAPFAAIFWIALAAWIAAAVTLAARRRPAPEALPA
jgi:hypothetical protein